MKTILSVIVFFVVWLICIGLGMVADSIYFKHAGLIVALAAWFGFFFSCVIAGSFYDELSDKKKK